MAVSVAGQSVQVLLSVLEEGNNGISENAVL